MTIPALIDVDLVRRLERAEAMANAAFVEARKSLAADVGAEWIEVAGAYAMFDGPESPITQTFGLGLFEPFGKSEFRKVESFFCERGAPTAHEVSSFADRASLALLNERGYSPIEASAVLLRDTSAAPSAAPAAAHADLEVRTIDGSEAELWARTSAQGWGSESPELAAFVETLGGILARTAGAVCFVAELERVPVAAAAMYIVNGVALLAGASTIPGARRRGAQQALLGHRLALAAKRGIELAMVVTQPGSASQRNAERQGFRAAYTRTKWRRE
ncbi:MAG TPA: GNAT family N-acetyltransferase [Gemmatimonadaceae bacterium]|nr:GNAT family N-acetyltransferase [Gemmatimonadaceae bacterium]